jgi:hypothetical protein
MKEPTRTVPLTTKNLNSYVQAARRLRRQLGDRAPTAYQLVEFEITGRSPRDIAAAYLDYLRDLERRRDVPADRPKYGGARSRPRVPLVRESAWPVRRPPAPMPDPSRN